MLADGPPTPFCGMTTRTGCSELALVAQRDARAACVGGERSGPWRARMATQVMLGPRREGSIGPPQAS